MKLVKIEDVRVGQIRKYKDFQLLILNVEKSRYEDIETDYVFYIFKDGLLDYSGILKKDFIDFEVKKDMVKTELIGFLNITHKLEKDEDGRERLVEIPRKEFEVDDVVELGEHKFIFFEILKEGENYFYEENEYVYMTVDIDRKNGVAGLSSYTFTELVKNSRDFKKIGILGVNYEFVNDLL
jgi:hypothetical protein